MKAQSIAILIVAFGIFLATQPARAGGSLLVKGGDGLQPLEIVYQHVAINIDDRLAKTVVTQVFANNTDSDVEGTYVFPLPRDAAVAGFAMWQDGKRINAAIQEKQEARQAYEEAASADEAPALLESLGSNRFQMAIFAIPAGGTRRIELTYTELLDYSAGTIGYTFPSRFRKEISQEIGLFHVDATIRCREEIAFASSPSYPLAQIQRHGQHKVFMRLNLERYEPSRDVDVLYGMATSPFAVDSRAYRATPNEPGYFSVAFAFNRDPQTKAEREPREIIIALDTSLSMAGEPLRLARRTVDEILPSIEETDSINLVTFDTILTSFWEHSVPAEPENVADGLNYLKALHAQGGSDLGMLLRNLRVLFDAGPSRRILVLLTDGQPTAGDTEDERLASFNDLTDLNVHLFVVHVGYPTRKRALERLSPDLIYHYVAPGVAGTETTNTLIREMTSPAFDNLQVRIEGPAVVDVYPATPRTLFEGQQLVVFGRYQPLAGIPALVAVTGELHGAGKRFVHAMPLPLETDERQAAIAREWAKRHVTALLDQIDSTEDLLRRQSLVQQVIELSRQHGLVTRYTSYLARRPAELSLDRFKPGDPELYIDAPANALAVHAMLPWGESIPCSYLPELRRWMGRFLVPRGTADGVYRITIVVVQQGSDPKIYKAYYRVDSLAPKMSLDIIAEHSNLKPGGQILLRATPLQNVFEGRAVGHVDHIQIHEQVDIRRIVVQFAGQTFPLQRVANKPWWQATAAIPTTIVGGPHSAVLVVTDYAANTHTTQIEVPISPIVAHAR